MNQLDNVELNRQVEELLSRGLIRESMNLYVVLALLTPNKACKWRMCIDSRIMDGIIVKYSCSLPIIDDLLDNTSGARYFTNIDLKRVYQQIYSRGDEWKTSIITKNGSYEQLVMPFGLTNA
jgi:hypothetical protein